MVILWTPEQLEIIQEIWVNDIFHPEKKQERAVFDIFGLGYIIGKSVKEKNCDR